jgi:hypothetical protein
LGVVLYRGTGRRDSARIDYEELLNAYRLAPEIYSNPLPTSLSGELDVPSGSARLNVVAFTGLSPVKEERNIIIPLPFAFPNNSARIAYPVMTNRPQRVTHVEAVMDTGERFALELLENMGEVARETFKSGYSLTIIKTAARVITKAGASAAAAGVVRRNSDSAFGLLAGVAGRAFTEVSEKADTRISRFFPSNALVGAINLPPGSYTVRVNFYSGSSLIESQVAELELQENAPNLVRFVCIR